MRDNPFAATKGTLFAGGVEHVNAFPSGLSNNLATIKSHFLRALSHLSASSDHGKLPEPEEIVTWVHADVTRQRALLPDLPMTPLPEAMARALAWYRGGPGR